MKRFTMILTTLTLLITGLWLVTGWSSFTGLSFFGLRNGLIQLSGVLAIWFMTVAVFLASRPRWLEFSRFGLDSHYRVHKWTGILAVGFSIIHWFIASGFKLLMNWGLLPSPAASGNGPARPEGVQPEQMSMTIFQQLNGLARHSAVWAFYVLLILGAVALLTFISYKFFALSHRLESLVYLMLIFHSAFLFTREYWLTPIGIFSAGFMAAGAVSALLIFFRITNRHKRTGGKIREIIPYPELDSMEVKVDLNRPWKKLRSGQFAFMITAFLDEPHPFSLTADSRNRGEASFMIKGLGNYTRKLPETLKAGDRITLEGPYGRFDFTDDKSHQIWIGAGVGIAPFLSRMKELAHRPEKKRVVLYHTTSSVSERFQNRLRADAADAGIDLRIWNSREKGRLTARAVMEDNPGWQEGGFWFCGPEDFAKKLKRDLTRSGLNGGAFHRELFAMR